MNTYIVSLAIDRETPMEERLPEGYWYEVCTELISRICSADPHPGYISQVALYPFIGGWVIECSEETAENLRKLPEVEVVCKDMPLDMFGTF